MPSGELGTLNSSEGASAYSPGNIERTITFDEADRKL